VWLRLALAQVSADANDAILEQQLTGIATLVHRLLSCPGETEYPSGGLDFLRQVLNKVTTAQNRVEVSSDDRSVTAKRASAAGEPAATPIKSQIPHLQETKDHEVIEINGDQFLVPRPLWNVRVEPDPNRPGELRYASPLNEPIDTFESMRRLNETD
jgi:hypothetical protein